MCHNQKVLKQGFSHWDKIFCDLISIYFYDISVSYVYYSMHMFVIYIYFNKVLSQSLNNQHCNTQTGTWLNISHVRSGRPKHCTLLMRIFVKICKNTHKNKKIWLMFENFRSLENNSGLHINFPGTWSPCMVHVWLIYLKHNAFNSCWCRIEHIWAASWENQQNDCAPSEDSDQPGHPSTWRKLGSLATHWAHSEDSIRLGGWFSHEAAHFHSMSF